MYKYIYIEYIVYTDFFTEIIRPELILGASWAVSRSRFPCWQVWPLSKWFESQGQQRYHALPWAHSAAGSASATCDDLVDIFDSGSLLSLLYDAQSQEFERWCEFQTHDENIMRIDTELDWIIAWYRKVRRKMLYISVHIIKLINKETTSIYNSCLGGSPFQQQC